MLCRPVRSLLAPHLPFNLIVVVDILVALFLNQLTVSRLADLAYSGTF